MSPFMKGDKVVCVSAGHYPFWGNIGDIGTVMKDDGFDLWVEEDSRNKALSRRRFRLVTHHIQVGDGIVLKSNHSPQCEIGKLLAIDGIYAVVKFPSGGKPAVALLADYQKPGLRVGDAVFHKNSIMPGRCAGKLLFIQDDQAVVQFPGHRPLGVGPLSDYVRVA